MAFHPILHEGGGPAPPPAGLPLPADHRAGDKSVAKLADWTGEDERFGLNFPQQRRGNSEQSRLGFVTNNCEELTQNVPRDLHATPLQ